MESLEGKSISELEALKTELEAQREKESGVLKRDTELQIKILEAIMHNRKFLEELNADVVTMTKNDKKETIAIFGGLLFGAVLYWIFS